MLQISMEYDDRALAFLRAFPQFAARAEKSAVSSAGWRMRAAIRKYIRSGGEGAWPRSVKLEFGEARRARRPLQALAAMVYYAQEGFSTAGGHPVARIYPGMDFEWRMRMLRGWMAGRAGARGGKRIGKEAPSPMRFFRKAEEGAVYPVTEKMRRAMALMGMPMRKTTTELVVPRRPIFEPVWNKERKTLGQFMLERYVKAMLRYATEGRLGKKEAFD